MQFRPQYYCACWHCGKEKERELDKTHKKAASKTLRAEKKIWSTARAKDSRVDKDFFDLLHFACRGSWTYKKQRYIIFLVDCWEQCVATKATQMHTDISTPKTGEKPLMLCTLCPMQSKSFTTPSCSLWASLRQHCERFPLATARNQLGSQAETAPAAHTCASSPWIPSLPAVPSRIWWPNTWCPANPGGTQILPTLEFNLFCYVPATLQLNFPKTHVSHCELTQPAAQNAAWSSHSDPREQRCLRSSGSQSVQKRRLVSAEQA